MTTENDYLEHIGAQAEAIASGNEYPEPKLETIISMADAQFEKFGKFHAQCARADEFHRGQINVPTAEGGQMVVVPIAHTNIETFADHIDTDHVQIEVRSGPRGQAAAEIRAKFFAAVLAHSEQEKMFLYTASKHLALYGVAVVKRFHDADRWPNRPQAPPLDADDAEWNAFARDLADFADQRSISHPITDDVYNPQHCVWDLSRGRKRWLIEKYMESSEALKKRFGDDYEASGSGDVEVVEYWDDQYMAVVVEGLWLVKPRWHGYKCLPYVVIEPAMGIDSMDAPPEERYVGLITPNIQELIIELSRLISQYDTIVRGEAWPNLYFQGPPDLVEFAKKNWDVHPGAKNALPEGVTVAYLIPPPTMQQIMDVYRLISSLVEDDTMPRVVRGAEPQNRSSGFEVSARAGMARLKLKAAAKALATAVQELNVIAVKILEHVIRAPVTVFAQTATGLVEQKVRPEDVKGQYNSKVTLEASSPEDRVQRGMFGIQLRTNGLASELMVRRDYLGQTNALEDMMQTKAEQMFANPLFQQTMLQLAGDAFAVFLAQQEQVASSTGTAGAARGPNSGQFGPGMLGAFPTTSAPDQKGRAGDRLNAIQPGGLQDIQNKLGGLSKPGAGPINVTGGATISPNGSAARR